MEIALEHDIETLLRPYKDGTLWPKYSSRLIDGLILPYLSWYKQH